jgi:hypothetical protein
MSQPGQRRPILTDRALDDLKNVKQQILDAADGRISERLVLATAVAAVRSAQGESRPATMFSARVAELVQDTLLALAQKKWKPDTALKLRGFHRGSRHERAE